jgi:hypothetical protein
MKPAKQAPPQTGLDVATQALTREGERLEAEIAAIDAAVEKRGGLVGQLKAVKAALAALVAPPATKPAAKRRTTPVKSRATEIAADLAGPSALRKLAIVKAATRPSKPPAASTGVAHGVTDEEFIRLWQASGRAKEVADKLGVTGKQVSDRAGRLRAAGHELKRSVGGRLPGVRGAKAKKPTSTADAEERPAVPEPTPVVKMDIRPKRGFQLFARAAAKGDAKPFKPRTAHVPVEIQGGQVYGHWQVIAEVRDEHHGQRRALVRSTCDAKTQRRVLVGELVGLRLPERCRGCRRMTDHVWGAEKRAEFAQRQRDVSRGRYNGMPTTYRCSVEDQGHPCGALIYASRRREHLLDVYHDGEADVEASFTGPIDPNANREAA